MGYIILILKEDYSNVLDLVSSAHFPSKNVFWSIYKIFFFVFFGLYFQNNLSHSYYIIFYTKFILDDLISVMHYGT